MRDVSDNIRSDMNTRIEFALLIGSIAACGAIEESTSVGAVDGFIYRWLEFYLVNEATGR